MNTSRAVKRRFGFTYVELIAVMAIILLLMTLLLPTFLRARDSARGSSCRSNLQQVATALHLYAQDYNGHFPPSADTAFVVLQPSIKNYAVLTCPSEPRESREHYQVGHAIQLPDGRLALQSSYLYRPGFTNDALPDTPLARDWSAWHDGGVDVLYLGGWVKWERNGLGLPGARPEPPAGKLDPAITLPEGGG